MKLEDILREYIIGIDPEDGKINVYCKACPDREILIENYTQVGAFILIQDILLHAENKHLVRVENFNK